jgi:uncharacterized protein (TIGR03032 family)
MTATADDTAGKVAPDPTDGEVRRTLDLKISSSPEFAEILEKGGFSLLVTTYDAGKLIVLRADKGTLNVHFVGVGRTMGVAANVARMAVGIGPRIVELYNLPVLAPRIAREDGAPAYDACYVPRHSHATGNIDIHEMAYGGDTLWYINTRFSCLCTLDPRYSFVPRWRPPFVKGLSGDDRCHLNGLGMYGDKPTVVTAFSVTDEPEGWRPVRGTGGIMMEIGSGAIIAQGMSMPHSPRIYGDEIWVLESGKGTMAHVDRRTGAVRTIAEFAGFTRGLDFAGNLAFVGLSRVREKSSKGNVFDGLPITERLSEEERFCGIQVLDLSTGRIVAMLRFESGVQDIFAVQVLHGMRFPGILEEDDPLVADAFALPDDALKDVR